MQPAPDDGVNHHGTWGWLTAQICAHQQGVLSNVICGQNLHLMKGLHCRFTLTQHVLGMQNGVWEKKLEYIYSQVCIKCSDQDMGVGELLTKGRSSKENQSTYSICWARSGVWVIGKWIGSTSKQLCTAVNYCFNFFPFSLNAWTNNKFEVAKQINSAFRLPTVSVQSIDSRVERPVITMPLICDLLFFRLK